jgi:hypothetical protein
MLKVCLYPNCSMMKVLGRHMHIPAGTGTAVLWSGFESLHASASGMLFLINLYAGANMLILQVRRVRRHRLCH